MKITIILLLLGVCLNILPQNTVKTDEFRNDLDKTITTRALPVEKSPTYVLSGSAGLLKRVPVLNEAPYPVITSAASDTTGRSSTKAGDIFIDTQNNKVYISEGAGRGKYILLNFILLLFLIKIKE